MRSKTLSLILVLILAFGLLGLPKPVEAAGYGTTFLTSITYMNVGTLEAIINIDFYDEGATSVTQSYAVANLPVGAAASLGIGSVFAGSFKGSAVMAASQPLAATMVQLPQGATTVKNRPLSNGFSNGSTTVLIATALKAKFNSNTIISIQNAGTNTTTATVNFIHSTDGLDKTYTVDLAPGVAKYYDLGLIATDLGPVFNGSVRVSAQQPLVASVIELSTLTDAVYAFEGVPSGATKLYMPTAVCQFGPQNLTSFYAVQNTSASNSTKISVSLTGLANGVPVNVSTAQVTILPGQKASVSGCGDAGTIPSKFLGSAVINSISVDGGTTPAQDIITIGKIAGNGSFVTSFVGVSQGSAKLALPYVRYSDLFYSYTSTRPVQQTNIALQNIGPSLIPANTIVVKFTGPDGSVKGTYTYPNDLLPNAKFSVNPKTAGVPEFGYVADAITGLPISYGGGASIVAPAGSQLAAIARVQTSTAAGDVAEDYNGIPIE